MLIHGQKVVRLQLIIVKCYAATTTELNQTTNKKALN